MNAHRPRTNQLGALTQESGKRVGVAGNDGVYSCLELRDK
jgi:hypothetical protein